MYVLGRKDDWNHAESSFGIVSCEAFNSQTPKLRDRIWEILSRGSSRCDAEWSFQHGHWHFGTGSLKIPPKAGGYFITSQEPGDRRFIFRTQVVKIAQALDSNANNSRGRTLWRCMILSFFCWLSEPALKLSDLSEYCRMNELGYEVRSASTWIRPSS